MKIICIDIETTGLEKETGEILQVSVCDEKLNVIFNEYTKPEKVKEWPAAMEINNITPEMVKNKPPFAEIREKLQAIIDEADLLITYNGTFFDIPWLEKNGISFEKLGANDDIMDSYANYKRVPGKCGYRKFRLAEAAAEFGYEYNAHDSAEDVKATVYVWEMIRNAT